ncbi:hypothetical protein QTP86_031969 [Hemibagrus guttatus]|nr:hypothetical protein QTP86_031969 [Hemibagrus guttatus]
MALWIQISQKLPYLSNETMVELYPTDMFPIDVRHYLANWIEEQRWEDFDVENREQEPQALLLLERMLELLQEVVYQNPNVVEKVKLQHICRNMGMFQSQPLELVRTVRDILRKERHLLRQPVQIFPPMPAPVNGTPQHSREASSHDVDSLVMKVLEIQSCRQQIHQLQEELNWEKQEADPMQGPNEMEVKQLDQVNKQKRIAQLEWKYQSFTKTRLQLLQDAVCNLEQCQTRLIHRIKSWRWEQLRSTIGRSFDENLLPLQTWCEQLLGVNGNLRQELMLVKRDHGSAEPIHKLEESLNRLLQTLIQSSLVVEKQPPQVIKTQSKFSSTVRYLLGEKVAPGKPVLLKAQIITESQARNMGQGLIPTVLEGSWEFAQPVHMCFVDLEKTFDRVPRGILWEVLWEYGVHGPLLRAVRSLYTRSRSLVRIASCKSDLFPVHVGLRQGCPLSPVLFIVFMDRISRRSQGLEGVRFGDHRISSLLFADDVVLLAPSGLDLQHALGRFAAEFEVAGMRVNTSKSEAMVLDRKKVACTLQVGGELLPQVEEFKYLSLVYDENVGELINSTAILEHNTTSKSTCATFRNMSIRKIKRADRKGSESVTEEKFALLFTTEITITGCDSPYSVQVISLPVVVIVHGSQENNAMATIIWDCAFSEPNRIPFVVPDRVPWSQMSEALSSKFMSEVQTTHALDRVNLHCLAQKIFDKTDNSEDFSNAPVSWAQFNKEVLPGRNFTFWQWFEGVIDLTKKCLKAYWSDGLILGFIGKQHLHVILQNQPSGTFLLRFSDSEIGGITIAYVGLSDFPSAPNPDGYLPFKLTTVVDQEPGAVMMPPAEPMQDFHVPVSLPTTPFAPSYPEAPMSSQGEMYPTILYSNSMTPEASSNMELEEILSDLNTQL